MKKLFVLFALFTPLTMAHNIQLNQVLPNVTVVEDGELIKKNDDIIYQKWHSLSLAGKVRIVNHFAGRSEAKEKNNALIEAIRNAHFDRSIYQTTTIINVDEATFGTGVFVKSKAKKGKLKNAHSQVVLDQNGTVKKAWDLKPKGNFVAVLDKNGKVKFVFDGKLSANQINQVIQLVKQLTL
ncbi:YtfJ family protein [Pasteurella skyensis]|uniref:YtfJ family protein n=1 Tax=Phocoenobacter skyensis TaxID=97481 RepID=A0AAJ6NDC0_9PAST|nr:YtfJ family protein [Pasteurella skyensis]MDP8170754.1 YtfJ family protein [Pasteurella skyensis]MDP8174713.1 YtfJ family protein [Pasteurella skyensis]